MSRKKKQSMLEQATLKDFSLKKIVPLTDNQSAAFEAFSTNDDIILSGFAGTGKTYIGLYLALNSIFTKEKYKKLVIFRSAVASRDIGFLPGSLAEKMQVYESPYRAIVDDLFGRGDGYDILKLRDRISFESTSYLRGTTYDNCIILVDEFQNLDYGELKTIITRTGKNTKMIFSGDYHQTDLKNSKEKVGVLKFLDILSMMDGITTINFTMDDIVRGPRVKEFIKCEYQYDIDKLN